VTPPGLESDLRPNHQRSPANERPRNGLLDGHGGSQANGKRHPVTDATADHQAIALALADALGSWTATGQVRPLRRALLALLSELEQ
jgi:hypothetical protein